MNDIDDGYSGTNFNRPAFKELLKDITNEKINAIIVKDLSRFGRNHIKVDNYLENIFPLQNVSFRKDNQIDLFSGYLKCADCGKELTIRKIKIKYIIIVVLMLEIRNVQAIV